MTIPAFLHRSLTAGVATALVAGSCIAVAAPVRSRTGHAAGVRQLPPTAERPTRNVLLSIGQGELINLPVAVSDIWVSAPDVADVYVDNARRIHLFGKAFGEATVFATSASGAVVYSANVRVSQNITSVDAMLKAAMPDANIRILNVGQMAVLTGTVASPADSVQAQQLVASLLNPGVDVTTPGAVLKIAVINRLKTATPLQVNLQVRIAEVSRSFVKNIGINLQNRQNGSGAIFGIASGRAGGGITTVTGNPVARYVNGAPVDANGLSIPATASGLLPGATQYTFPGSSTGAGTVLGLAGHALGMDLLSSLDLGETDGQVTTLAQPNLTAMSGETASFLAGGEIPIPVSQGLGAVSIEYKQYGISLSYTPTVLSDGRISLRVRPEVSQLSAAGAVTLNGVSIPGLTTRRAETTLELGSGQSMVIGGLISNDNANSIDKAPGLGDVPVLGALFRSNAWKRNETELMIVITPYLVRPVQNPSDIVLPTDGSRAPTDLGRVFKGDLGGGVTGAKRPVPTMAPSAPPLAIGGAAPALPAPSPDALRDSAPKAVVPKKGQPAAMPGFSE
ncbi:type II and III secretion system protein family protein [Sphingomonas bacterium]|uniref:type II and III secretion system protein family protein n=1 Tax=Sphingomonas bacterium TaxID=1895847 RepID=UPI0015753728|nr:type II and III secretion system protein family protein [Sphingomonas bacterium]